MNSQKSLNLVIGSRADAKAAYRLLANDGFALERLQDGVAQTTRTAMAGISVVLLLQDTTDINYNTHKKTAGSRCASENVVGNKIFSCIAVTPEGTPIGLMSQSYIKREEVINNRGNSEKSKRVIEEKESNRWLETLRETTKDIPDGTETITICDREGDYHGFCNEVLGIKEKFVVRVVNNHVTDSDKKLCSVFENSFVCGTATVNIPQDTRRKLKPRIAVLDISYAPVTLKQPVIKAGENIAETSTFNFVRIIETNPPKNIEPIEWILATNLDVSNTDEAFLIVQYYVERRKVERFHYVLKSGCKIKEIQQRNVERVMTLLLIYSVIAVFILSMTLAVRSYPNIMCDTFFEEYEWKILSKVANHTTKNSEKPYKLYDAIKYLKIFAGRKLTHNDRNIKVATIWQGLFALYSIADFAPFVSRV